MSSVSTPNGNRPRRNNNNNTKPVTKQQVRDMLRSKIELKFFTGSTGEYGISTSGSITRMTGVNQGVIQSNRTGDLINPTDLELRYTFTSGATGVITGADEFNVMRILLFRWHMDDTSDPPTLARLIAGSTNKTLAPYNREYDEQYTILYDAVHCVYNTPVWNGSAVSLQRGYGSAVSVAPPRIPLKGSIHFALSGNTGVGHIYCLMVSDSTYSPSPTGEAVIGLRYTDA